MTPSRPAWKHDHPDVNSAVQTITPHRAGGRRPTPRPRYIIATITVGMVIPVQARINGELSNRLGDGLGAAALSFSGGLILMSLAAACSARLRRALRTLVNATWERRLRIRYLFAGVLGAAFALAQSTTALIAGIAVFTVSAIAGQTLSGLIVDARGIGGGARQRPGGVRLLGAVLILVAALVAALPQFSVVPSPATAILPSFIALVAGFLLGIQQVMNGAVGAVAGSPLAATWLNFFIGALVLGAVWGGKTLILGPTGSAPPTAWWTYLGGLCGVVFIGASTFLVRKIGVLLLGMASIAGQLISSIALDLATPSASHPPSILTAVGAAITLAAVWAASRPDPGQSET